MRVLTCNLLTVFLDIIQCSVRVKWQTNVLQPVTFPLTWLIREAAEFPRRRTECHSPCTSSTACTGRATLFNVMPVTIQRKISRNHMYSYLLHSSLLYYFVMSSLPFRSYVSPPSFLSLLFVDCTCIHTRLWPSDEWRLTYTDSH